MKIITSGVIEPPPRLVAAVWDAAQDFFYSGEKTRTVRIPVHLEGWKYNTPKIKAKIAQKFFEAESEGDPNKFLWTRELTTTFIRVSSGDTVGSFGLVDKSLIIKTSPKDRGLPWVSVIRHELTHFAQTFLSAISYLGGNLKPRKGPGMPSEKIKTPQFSQHNKPKIPFWERLWGLTSKKIPKKTSENWMGDDVEFYPILGEIVSFARDTVLLFPGMFDKGKFFNDIVGEKFFITLKSRPEFAGKYKKAISELYKAIFQ